MNWRISSLLVTLSVVAIAGAVGVFGWLWWSRERVRGAHAERGAGYAARLLEQTGTLPDALGESSGVAVSRVQPGVLWSHNDSGDGPRIYAIDRSGRLLATVQVARATARDWEDMDAGPCPAAAGLPAAARDASCLYIADIGDNGGVRDTVAIHVIDEPRLDRLRGGAPAVTARSVRFRYPDGPDDSEAIAVLPNGDVIIVTKGRAGTIDFYRLSRDGIAEALVSGTILTAEREGNTGIAPEPAIGRYVTGAAASPDGTALAVRTYTEVFFFSAVQEDGRTRWRNTGRPCFLGYVEPLGEAIAYLDPETLILTSERRLMRPGPIHLLRCRAG